MPKKYAILFVVFCQGFLHGINAQPAGIIHTRQQYASAVAQNGNSRMVNLKKLIPQIVLDLKYATTDNFTGINLYKKASTTYLCYPAATALQKVSLALAAKGYGLKVFDAYRPYTATKLMWELIKDERYVANPKNGSNHNKGLAIDLTLTDNNGKELPMGTGFDNFTDTAHHSFTGLGELEKQNRYLLKTTMEAAGFKALESEWWHYSYSSPENFAVIDISFKNMQRFTR